MIKKTTSTLVGMGATFSIDGCPEYDVAGVTIDPAATLPVAATPGVTLADGQVIKTGKKFFPFGGVFYLSSPNYYLPWDGVATLNRGEALVINRTRTEDDGDFMYPGGMMEGGRCHIERAKCVTGGVWVALTAAQTSALLAALPRLEPERISRP